METVEFILTLAFFAVALVGGFVIGRIVETNHLKRLDADERDLSSIRMSDLARLPTHWRAAAPALVTGTAVVATDYFKVVAASLRNLFGGGVRSYETLVSRARREAIVRMLREARSHGANVVWNVRIETATIQGKQQGKSGGVEVIAYGTALHVDK